MVITLVMEQYGALNNGTTATAMRLGKYLIDNGHEVRVITCADYDGKYGEKIYKLNKHVLPLFNSIVEKQGMCFAECDDDIIKKALEGTDLVHIILPFNLGKRVKKICLEQNIPYTTAFHCQPENITSTIYLEKLEFINTLIYHQFRKFYSKDDVVHCPSEMIKKILKKHKYQSDLRVISNGITDTFKMQRTQKPEVFKDKIVLVSAGRFSREKRQDLMIDAVCKSKYSKHIVLILCGKGPKYNSLKKRAERLENKAILKFCTQEELIEIFNYADLYLHASNAEIEGLACMEAFACGCVPLISNSKKSATSQFALNENCIFKHNSSRDLARKIDYMIENPDLLMQLRKEYAEEAENYRLDKCLNKLMTLFEERINPKKKDDVEFELKYKIR